MNKLANKGILEKKDSSKPKGFLRKLMGSPIHAVSLIYLVTLIIVVFFGRWLTPHDINNIDIINRLLPPLSRSQSGLLYLFGTDALGRDLFSLILYGTRISMIVGICSVFIGGILGVVLGLISGFFNGFISDIIMRLADLQLSFPPLLILIAIMSVLKPGLFNAILVLAISRWVTFARVVRAETLSIKEMEYVKAAHATGCSRIRILVKYILPNVFASILVVGSLSVASAIMDESVISFLGIGLPSSMPSWGRIMADARPYMRVAPWLLIFPGAVLFLTIFSINLLGDWLRDYFDPTIRHNK